MVAFGKLIHDISSRYHLGPKGGLLVERALDLIASQPGGVRGFLDRFRVAGFGEEVASWTEGTAPVPLTGQEVEQALGSKAVKEIADKVRVSQVFARTVLGYAIPRIISELAQSSLTDLALPHAAPPIDEPIRHGARPISQGILSWLAAPAFKEMLLPASALLVMLGVIGSLVYLGVSHHTAPHTSTVTAQHTPSMVPPAPPKSVYGTLGTTSPMKSQALSKSPAAVAQNAPAVVAPSVSKEPPVAAQKEPVASPSVPSIPARLVLSNQNNHIAYSGTVGDETTRIVIIDALKTEFGANNISGDLSVDEHVGPASWTTDLNAVLDHFKTPGLQAQLENDSVKIGGAIPGDERDRIVSSLKSTLGPQVAVASLGGPTVTSAASGQGSISNPAQASLDLPDIYFAINSAAVPADSKAALEKAAATMRHLPSGTVVDIKGFTDSTGNPSANLRLSQRRANAVRQILVDAGVKPDRLYAKGYGILPPVSTTEGRSVLQDRMREERRVEFHIAQK